MTVSALLALSRQCHLDAKRARAEGRIDDHFDQMAQALASRTEAHAQDPEHTDQAWHAERTMKFDHAACLQFYASELAKDVESERLLAPQRLKEGRKIVTEVEAQVEAFRAAQPPEVTH